jgi:hypothetical protein
MRMEQEVMLPVRVRPARSCGPGFMQKQYCGHCCLLIAFCFKVFLLFNNLHTRLQFSLNILLFNNFPTKITDDSKYSTFY